MAQRKDPVAQATGKTYFSGCGVPALANRSDGIDIINKKENQQDNNDYNEPTSITESVAAKSRTHKYTSPSQ